MSNTKAPKAETVAFDLDDLTIADIELIEEASGKSLADVFGGKSNATAMRAVAFIVGRRENPAYTWAEAGAVKVSMLDELAKPSE